MDKIRLYSCQIPDQVKKVVRTLVKGSDQDIKDILPIELRKIERNATECLALAEEVEKKFEFVMDLTGELDEVSSAAQGYYQKEQEETRKKKEIAGIKEKEVREHVANVMEQQKKLENQVLKAKEGFDNALASIPSTYGLVGMQYVETLTNVVANAASAMTQTKPCKTPFPSDYLKEDNENEEMREKGAGFPEARKLTNMITDLVECLKSGSQEVQEKKDSDGGETLTGKLQTTRIGMQDLEKDLPTRDKSHPLEKLSELLKEGLNICKEAEDLSNQISFQPEQMKAMAQTASKVEKEVRKFCTKAQASAGYSPLYTSPPRQAKALASAAKTASPSVIETAVENARFKVAQARGLLERQEERYDKACQELKDSNKKLSDVLQELAEFTPDKIANFEEIRKTLRLGLQALASLRERWQKLVEFFQFVATIIKVCQKESLKSFVEYAEVAENRALTSGYAGTDFMRDIIYEQVNQANTTSFVVWSISNMYVEISRNHLMGRLANLSELVALDPERDRHQIEMKKNELMEGSKEAQEAIKRLVWEAQDHYHDKVVKRIQKIELELLSVLPPEDPARIKEIQDTVSEAIKEADDEFGEEKF